MSRERQTAVVNAFEQQPLQLVKSGRPVDLVVVGITIVVPLETIV